MLINVDKVLQLITFPSSTLSVNGRRQKLQALSVSCFELSVVENHWQVTAHGV